MIDVSYPTAPCPVRADIEEAHTFFWQKLAAPGTWWTGAERVAMEMRTRLGFNAFASAQNTLSVAYEERSC